MERALHAIDRADRVRVADINGSAAAYALWAYAALKSKCVGPTDAEQLQLTFDTKEVCT